MEYSTSAPNERVSCITQLAKLSFKHSIGPGVTSCWLLLRSIDFENDIMLVQQSCWVLPGIIYLEHNCTRTAVGRRWKGPTIEWLSAWEAIISFRRHGIVSYCVESGRILGMLVSGKNFSITKYVVSDDIDDIQDPRCYMRRRIFFKPVTTW